MFPAFFLHELVQLGHSLPTLFQHVVRELAANSASLCPPLRAALTTLCHWSRSHLVVNSIIVFFLSSENTL